MENNNTSDKKTESFIDLAVRRHFNLRKDSDYKNIAVENAIHLIDFFNRAYPGIEIKDPLLRVKSPKSINEKIKSLSLERASKLAAVEADIPNKLHNYEINHYGNVTNIDYNQVYSLLSDRIEESIDEKKQPELKNILSEFLFDKISLKNLKDVEHKLLDNSKLSKNTKTALVRLYYAKIKSSSIDLKDELIQNIHAKYGTGLAQRSHDPENDLLDYSKILEIENTDYDMSNTNFDNHYFSKLDRLIDEPEFLRCKDLIGMQIIISSIPEGYKSQNEYINNLLDMRSKISNKNSKEYRNCDNECMNAIATDFVNNLASSSEFLNLTNSKIIRDSIKHKNKVNGYVADHIKFELAGNPDYSLELQVKSKYVDQLSKGKGSAAHCARFGKERILPTILQKNNNKLDNISNKDLLQFCEELEYRLPKFTVFSKNIFNKYKPTDFSLIENIGSFYMDSIENNNELLSKFNFLLNKIKKIHYDSKVEKVLANPKSANGRIDKNVKDVNDFNDFSDSDDAMDL